jgi:hypothetical protein
MSRRIIFFPAMYFKKIQYALAGLTLLAGVTSCELLETEEVPDQNDPGLASVLTSPSKPQLDALAVAVEASYRLMHTGNAPYNNVIGTLGREVTVQANTESRWYEELQGRSQFTGDVPLDDAAYYNGYYISVARVGRAARIYRQSAQNAASEILTDQQKAGINGFTLTYEALSKLMLLNIQGEGGIRIDLENELKPGPFVTPEVALTNIRQQLDEGAAELDKAGTAFGFTLSSGFAGFNTPTTFKQFNRALAARVALYQRDYSGALTALNQSFYNRAGDLAVGPKITFNPGNAGDQGNAYFQVLNNTGATVLTVPENFVREAEPNDARLSKVGLRTAPRSTGDISARYEVRRFASNQASLDIIRNEELVLIAAEARARTNDLAGALLDVNAVRTRSGSLPARGAFASVTDAEVEILKQRRYSLFFEGHWLVDLRRLNRYNPTPAPGITLEYSTGTYRLISRMPRPAAEVAWDRSNP